VVCLLVDVVVLFGVDICESSTGEYIEYSASPNLRCGEVDGGGLFGGDGFRMVEVDVVTKIIIRLGPGRALPFSPVSG
jgi:hypothetical protein